MKRDFRKQQLADVDLVLERFMMEKAREIDKIKKEQEAAAAEE